MAIVTQRKNGSYVLTWGFDPASNVAGSTEFQCPGRKPTFQLSYTYTSRTSRNDQSKFSASLKTADTGLLDQDYPDEVSAFLNGCALMMKQSTRGQWDVLNWTYNHCQEYDPYIGNLNRNAHLTLLIVFPHAQATHLTNQFSKLLDTGTMADVQFIVKGKEMAAHAAILSAASPVLAAMFEPGKFKESKSKKVEIEDIEPEVFQQLLHYIYTGTVPNMGCKTITEPLFLVADKYQMDQLKEECEGRLIRKLKMENAIGLLVMAYLHSAAKLQEASIQFLFENRKEICDRPEWKQLNESYPELFFLVSNRMVKNA